MQKIVVDIQNFLFADSIAAAFRNSDYDIDVVRAETPNDTVELCQMYKPFVLVMEVTGYTPWLLCDRLRLRDEVKSVCPDCKIALLVDSNTEKQAAKDIRDAKKNGIIDQFFYGSMTSEYLMDQIYAM
ncbi:MAG: hypothetical protein SOX69_04635 [Oscillospiraceae bacterium]|nr:hypothetical protein [Eubacterium sp.]MDY4254999.1 hypothetical protein [Oscillospiraceae bacterium]MDY5355247.1 hypothetical protein [Eubacteriales bacterium]CDE20243.1 uncharacterized protein BN797_01134 [Eubacterium sp. CAG:841]